MEILLKGTFFMLMTTFSKHRLMEINMACVQIMPEVKKGWGRNGSFDSGRSKSNLSRKIFLVGERIKFLAVG